MVFTIHRYLFAALLVTIGLDVLALNLALSLLYFALALSILCVMRKGAALDFWSVLLKSQSRLKAFLSTILSIVQLSLWIQVFTVIKSGHAGGLDAEEMKALQIVQSVFPMMVALAVPGIFLLNKLKSNLLNQMVAKCSATISESKDKSILCEQLNKLIVVERYRKNMVMAELHSRRLLELMEVRTHKEKKTARPKAKHVQARKCG